MAQVTYEIDILGERKVIEKLSDVDKALAEINNKIKNINFGDINFKSLLETKGQLKSLQKQFDTFNNDLQSTTQVGSQAGIALQNLNFVIRDTPYFFKDMQLGVLAVGNNINPLIDSFVRLRLEAARMSATTGTTVTTLDLLSKSLMGATGISVAFSLAVTAIQSYIFATTVAKSKTEKTIEKVDELESALNKLVNLKLPSETIEFKPDINQLKQALFLVDMELTKIKSVEDFQALNSRRNQETWGQSLDAAEQSNNFTKEELEAAKKILETKIKTLETEERARNVLKTFGLLEEKRKKPLEEQKNYIDSILETDKQIYEKIKLIRQELDKGTHSWREQKVLLEEMNKLLENFQSKAMQMRPAPEPQLRAETYIEDNKRPRPSEPLTAFNVNMKKAMREFNINLEMGKIAAHELGNELTRAFMGAKVTLDDFIKSLMSAIAQMLILRAVTSFLTGNILGGANAVTPVPALPKINSPLNINKQMIRVEGKITANKNQFIAEIENAKNYYYKNEKFIVVGR